MLTLKKLSLNYVESRYGILVDKIPAEVFGKKEAIESLKSAKEIEIWIKTQKL